MTLKKKTFTSPTKGKIAIVIGINANTNHLVCKCLCLSRRYTCMSNVATIEAHEMTMETVDETNTVNSKL